MRPGVRRALTALAALACGASTACAGDSPGRGTRGSSAAAATASASLAARAAQRCDGVGGSVVIDSAGIGPVLLGTKLSELASRCGVADTTMASSEGTPEGAHVVPVSNHALVVLSTGSRDTAVVRVITTDPTFRTPGGVGVNSSVESLRLAHGPLCAARGEGILVVSAANAPGVSFAIDWSPPPTLEPSAAETPFPGGDPGTALDDSRITRIWVHGVTGGCRVGVG